MKSLTEHLWFETPHRRDYVNITGTVEQLVRKRGVQEGLCLVNAMHITAAVFINDAEDGLLHDYDVWLEKLAPHEPVSQYHHNRTGEDNADAHLKRHHAGRLQLKSATSLGDDLAQAVDGYTERVDHPAQEVVPSATISPRPSMGTPSGLTTRPRKLSPTGTERTSPVRLTSWPSSTPEKSPRTTTPIWWASRLSAIPRVSSANCSSSLVIAEGRPSTWAMSSPASVTDRKSTRL